MGLQLLRNLTCQHDVDGQGRVRRLTALTKPTPTVAPASCAGMKSTALSRVMRHPTAQAFRGQTWPGALVNVAIKRLAEAFVRTQKPYGDSWVEVSTTARTDSPDHHAFRHLLDVQLLLKEASDRPQPYALPEWCNKVDHCKDGNAESEPAGKRQADLSLRARSSTSLKVLTHVQVV